MKIGIIGYGFVVSAIAHAYKQHEVIIIDPKLSDSKSYPDLKSADGIFICVPTPNTDQGYCDVSILKSVLKNLVLTKMDNDVPIISKSTAPPEAYARLQKQYPCLIHSPEFLVAKDALFDYKFCKWMILGGKLKSVESALEVVLAGCPDLRKDKIIHTDIKTASFYKYMMNNYLTTKVSFMNDFFELSVAEGVNWGAVKEISKFDNRIGNTHMDVPGPDGKYGWGGMCFPKDVEAICMEALDHGLEFRLMNDVRYINKRHREKNE